MYDKEIQEVFEKLKIIDKLYDHIRLVDPLYKKVITNKTNNMNMHTNCFDFWGKNEICNNCITMRAYNDDQVYAKMEYSGDKIYMVTAIPIQLPDRRVIVELLKNTTDSMVFQSSNMNSRQSVIGMITEINTLAARDDLTGIYNRRYIYEKLPVDLVSASVSNRSLAVAMTDIDYFKSVNDTYGHLAGDYVLKSFAEIISKHLRRKSDWVARYGGEEFLICIPEASKEAAVEILEHMRKELEETELSFNGNSFRITASFGVCDLVPTTDMTMESLIENADRNLYLAKNHGRNRVEV